MSNISDGNKNSQSAKVVKLGLNISVSGDPGTDFEIVLDDKEKKALQSSSPKEDQCFDVLESERSTTDAPKHELENTNTQEVTQSTGAIPKQSKFLNASHSSDPAKMSDSENADKSTPLSEKSILNKIKSTMEHFEKFSDHIKEIPRLRNRPLATSTPFSDKHNSKSESSLVYPESRPRKFSHLYDFPVRKEYFRSSVRPSPPDLFLKPLPAENYYTRGIYTRFLDLDPYRPYGSDISLNKSSEYKSSHGKSLCYDVEKYEGCYLPPEPPCGILKKSDSESGDKQSTSSADSIKDIKIYQSGGILIMQNFKDNMDVAEKKEMSELSAKLIENCNKLRMEVSGFQEEKLPGVGFSEESKSPGKMVQFDLSSFEGGKSKSEESPSNPVKEESSGRVESSESTSDCMKNKDTSPLGTSQSQDLTSLSTQENDSFMSNPPGASPTYASAKKLEWDSGADVGYLNLDLTKENLSTIEKIVLKGLSSDGVSEENIVYEKKLRPSSKNRSKFTVERKPTDLIPVESNDESGMKTERRAVAERENEPGDVERKKKTGKTSTGDKGDSRSKVEETKPESSKSSSKETPKANEIQPGKKPLEVTDKSVNVNTLFENKWAPPPTQNTQLARPVESHARPNTHRKTSYSPKAKVSKSKTRPSPQQLLKAPKKVTKLAPHVLASYFGMGNPKKVYKKVEASPVLNDAELSREVDEIIIDQRFKIKNVTSGREVGKEPEAPLPGKEAGKDKTVNGKENKTKSRPISASSSSNNTVLPKSDNGELHADEKTKNSLSKVTDQIIQTSDYDRESVGVQAFASQVSSDCDYKSFGRNAPKSRTKAGGVNTSSKNVQAFGLNSSLPKQLEHPTGTEIIDNQNTKSTQFFGGPLNSLPNYHSNLVTKPVESCGRAPNVLKTKRNSEAEIIRVKAENEKNILANDAPKGDQGRKTNNENKENLITQKSTNSKRSQSNASGKNSNGNGDSDRRESSGKGKKKSGSVESCAVAPDDVSSLVLTSEVLKVHSGDSVDRNIIQEKYFQSQLAELEKRQMISRSTSMEIQLQLGGDGNGKEYMTTGCQYSPQSRGTTSGGREPEEDSYKENNRKIRSYADYMHHNADEEGFLKSTNQDQNAETGDSLPSSTQTAHSWVAGMRNSGENSSGVGKARSFEYLPGHIYESSGNLREELPSETEQNIITSSSSDSDTARGTVSNDGARNSEGRNTLILENSTQSSHGSEDRLKILDQNLEQLNLAVLKLWEKDAQVQSITQSLLASLFVKTGSGDWLGGADTLKTEAGNNKDEADNAKERVAALSEIAVQAAPKDDTREREFSIACQTEKSPQSDTEKFYEERRALEKRISEEKKCQIKWIENEIHHLNILRELLERQSSPIQRKKKRSVLSLTSNEASKSEENYKGISPRAVTPVYGCTISLTENLPQECNRPASEPNDRPTRESSPPQYGLALSLSGCPKNWRRVVMLPAGVQVSMKDPPQDGNDESTGVFRRGEKNLMLQPSRSNAHTQYPSARRASLPCASIQTDFPSPERCNPCTKENCMCLNLSVKSYSSSSKSKTYDRRESSKLRFINEECDTENGNKTSNSTDPDFLEIENCPVSDKSVSKYPGDPSDPSESYAKSKSALSTNCQCQNCPKHVSSTVVRATCRGPCQSNIYLGCDKSPDELGTCRCSRIQVKKSANCTCHVIKIHGSKCCTSDRSSCNRHMQKKTENQSCQTECEPVVAKELITYPEISKLTEAPQVKDACVTKVGVEKKNAVLEKLSCETKVPYEKVHSNGEANCPEENTREEVAPVVLKKTPAPNCHCGKRRSGRDRERVDDHPRHYFLRIEEAEIDDSNEQIEQKKQPLEVVTVTVPVKKAGKSKIYNGNIRQTRETFRYDANRCNCCAECAQHQKPGEEYEPRVDLRRSRSERPDSPPTRITSGVKPSECNTYEDLNYNPRVNYSSDRQEYYSERGGFAQPAERDGFTQPAGGNEVVHCCEGCNCINRNTPPREVQCGYDSHKRRNANGKECHDGGRSYEERKRPLEQINRARYDGAMLPERVSECQDGGRSCEERRKPLEQNKPRYDGGYSSDRISESKHSRGQEYNQRSDRYDSEFYNYNKREFMTRSELIKEEEMKRKIHQPSLQECLSSNRPDFYTSAERRRQIISERAKERVNRHNRRMDCMIKMMQKCNQNEPRPSGSSKRIFTTMEMREQTMRRYRKLPEVTGKIADEKKKEEYRTNRLMADIFAKKLQSEALKGHINLSNSVSVLYTI